jgi:oligosaccharyltransferase complex subunit beta
MKVFALVALVALLGVAFGERTLVVVDNLAVKDTHSIFFKSLTDRGHVLSFVDTDANAIPLQKYGEYLYENVIVFAPKIDDSLDSDAVLEFIDSGRNVLLAADTGASANVRDIAAGVGATFADPATVVIDHLNFDQSDFDGHHSAIIADDFIANAPLFLGGKKIAPVLFRGIGQDLRDSALNYRILSASGSAFSGRVDGKAGTPKLLGKKNVLVSALQARNGARVVVSGSLALFSDASFGAKVQKYAVDGKGAAVQSGNQDFAIELSKWVFAEKGVLRYRDIEYVKVNAHINPNVYTIKDNIHFSIVIEERVNGKWVPYKADDVQLEFIMLDPYVRTNLKHDNKGNYSASFQLPDVYGVFTFKVDYQRPGYTPLTAVSRVPVRPFRHDQYERFIGSAFPYYAGAFSMLGGLFIFSVVFLYHKD